ncbi:hypothetical protein CEP54_015407 [Fusarium duplospermum]|uniref:Uncharacterized protein n=1 Tax=Fusarium duplospermum TaxID=1325734 RepID=A0A428NPB3_9HYPO|nr:hypothetical protein CEP54_015407 [Fusarium duplospermum]
MGPTDGPRKGETEKRAIGAWISSRWKRSLIAPPETAKKALPEKPLKKRAIIIVL